MLKEHYISISTIYIPVKKKKMLRADTVEELAESIIDNGQKVPIQVRFDGKRYILVEGLHRLEACKALGEKQITSYIVQAQKH